MSAQLTNCTEAAGPVCLFLSERWRRARDNMDDAERHNLEMATITVLQWISEGDQSAEYELERATMMLRRSGQV